MNRLLKTFIILILLIIIGVGSAVISIKSGFIKVDNQAKNIVEVNQITKEIITFEINQTKLPFITETGKIKYGRIKYINETAGELIFDNESLGIITFGRAFLLKDLMLPKNKEKQAIDIALNDSKVKQILTDKKYNITRVQKIIITTADQIQPSEDNIAVEIEANNLTYFVNVDMIKNVVVGNVVLIPKTGIAK